MSATLHFYDGVDEVVTSSWTARPVKGGTEIAFLWGASGISFFDSATGVFRVTLSIAFSDFIQRISQGRSFVDLMNYSSM